MPFREQGPSCDAKLASAALEDILHDFVAEAVRAAAHEAVAPLLAEFEARILASIGFGFEREAPDAGPYLDPILEQSRHADALFHLVDTKILSDAAYVDRLRVHCRIVKNAASDPDHPAYDRLQKVIAGEAWSVPAGAPTETGRNDPCPCGSGKKFKHCCGVPSQKSGGESRFGAHKGIISRLF